MEEYISKLENISQKYNAKQRKKLQIDVFVRLCKKLTENQDEEINSLIKETFDFLQEYTRDESIKKKSYIKSFRALKKQVRDQLGFTPKGLIQEEMTGIGIAIGVALGGGFVGVNPAFVGIGIPIGLAIGAAMGKKKEDQAENEGKTY